MQDTVTEVARARALIALHEALAEAEHDLDVLLQLAAASTAGLLGNAAAVWIRDDLGLRLRALTHQDAAALDYLRGAVGGLQHNPDGLLSQVISTGTVLHVNRDDLLALVPSMEPAYAEYVRSFGAGPAVIVPLVSRTLRNIGAVGVARDAEAPDFGEEDVEFLQQVARVVTLGISNALLLDEVEVVRDRAAQLSLQDDLTGLLNRRGFLERLRSRAARDLPPSALVAVLDLDGFRLVNDGFGHAAGDVVLTSLAARLCAAVPPGTPVARLGGDEFAVLVEAADEEAAASVVEEAVRACTGSIEVVGLNVPLHVSVGTCVPTDDGSDGALLQADLAMTRAKRRGLVVAAYDPALDDPATRRLRDVLELRRSIIGDGLVVHYQPVVDVDGLLARRVEALVRRRVPGSAPEGALQLPGSWLPLAARAGLMPELTANVLHQVLDQLEAWWAAGLEVECAVNVPAPVLASPELIGSILARLDQAGLPRRALSVEVTEHDLVGPQARSALSRCADADIAVAVDDFGTGWSALSYLVDLPLRTLKIDRSFVADVDVEPRKAAVVRAVVDIAHELGLRVVAEGVETEAVADAVANLGADALQGFFLARPTGAAEVEQALRQGISIHRS